MWQTGQYILTMGHRSASRSPLTRVLDPRRLGSLMPTSRIRRRWQEVARSRPIARPVGGKYQNRDSSIIHQDTSSSTKMYENEQFIFLQPLIFVHGLSRREIV